MAETANNTLQTLPEGYADDPVVKALFNGIEESDNSYFITGKAGTGKSTFIHYLVQNSSKKVLVLAFTGIAAINVKGQTIHSVFQFPFKPLLPGDHEIKIFRKGNPKRRLLEKAEMILIDEVSMLRSDILEAMDYSLRVNGGDPQRPFGGKQMILVGDLFQLPPVVNEDNPVIRQVFNEVYKSQYFFDAPAYQRLKPNHFEFTNVHRQKDDLEFIELLDRMRMGKLDRSILDRLNERHSDKIQDEQEFSIHLTTTNAIADSENFRMLQKLEHPHFHFNAEVEGDFDKSRFPAPPVLSIKKESQIIIVKNDPNGRWVNGTIGKVMDITDDKLTIKLESGKEVKIGREMWENVRYTYDRDKGQIQTESIGTFTQFPVKLAWAITIHKSQGLTFDKVVIDLGRGAFVNGQAYTALSRCRTLEGITLKKPIHADDVMIDSRLTTFYEQLNH